MRIVIPGGAGQAGQILARQFHANNHAFTVVSRTPHPAPLARSVMGGPHPFPTGTKLVRDLVSRWKTRKFTV